MTHDEETSQLEGYFEGRKYARRLVRDAFEFEGLDDAVAAKARKAARGQASEEEYAANGGDPDFERGYVEGFKEIEAVALAEETYDRPPSFTTDAIPHDH